MKTAIFTNFSNEPYTGSWNGKLRKFESGESQPMPDYLARHFAKHLTNRELLKLGHERSTSPKFPEQVPQFMDLFNQAYTPEEDTEFVGEQDSVDVQIAMAKRHREQKVGKQSTQKSKSAPPAASPEAPLSKEDWKKAAKAKPDPNQPQVILPPDFDEDDEG